MLPDPAWLDPVAIFHRLIPADGQFKALTCAHNVNFLLSRLILHNTESTFSKKYFELHETQFFYNILKTFKFAAILVHHLHQSSSVLSQL